MTNKKNLFDEEFEDLTSEEDTPIEETGATQNTADNQQEAHASAGKGTTNEHAHNSENVHDDSSDNLHNEEQEQQDDEELQALKRLYGFHSAADMAQPSKPKTYLIKNWIEPGKLHLLFGDSGVKKTFTALDMGLSIACDQIGEWCRMNVKHGFVLYLAGEGQEGIKKRYNGWLQKHGVPSEIMKFGMFDAVFHLNETKDTNYSIDNTIKAIRMCFEKPALIIIDTLNRYQEGDESTTRDMTSFINACTKITRELDSAIFIISHTGNAQENKGRVRGSSALHGACDIVIKAEAHGDNGIKLDQKKHKDGIEQKNLILEFDTITLPPEWNDEDGEPVTTLVPKLSENSTHDKPYAQTSKKEKPLKGSQSRARKSFNKAIRSYGIRIHDEKTGHDLAAVCRDDWRVEAYDFDTVDNDNTKRGHFNADIKYLCEETEILIKRIIKGREYYCLDMQAEGEDIFRINIIQALTQHEQETAGAGKAIE